MPSTMFTDDAFSRELHRDGGDPAGSGDGKGMEEVRWCRLSALHELESTGQLPGEESPKELVREMDDLLVELSPNDIAQGAHPDCFFVTSVIAIARRKPELLRRLFVTRARNAAGRYELQFYRWGSWTEVVIDDFIPCRRCRRPDHVEDETAADGGEGSWEPLFTRSPTGRMWPLLLEKAFAKLHTSFVCIAGGNVPECLHDLTGLPVLHFGAQVMSDPAFWGQWVASSSIMTAGTLGGEGSSDTERATVVKAGLQPGHAYAVLAVVVSRTSSSAAAAATAAVKQQAVPTLSDFMLILENPNRNAPSPSIAPYGTVGSTLWNAKAPPQLQKQVEELLQPCPAGTVQSAVFAVTAAAFARHFNSFHACLVSAGDSKAATTATAATDKWSFEGTWKPGVSAGGCSAHCSFRTNPKFALTISPQDESKTAKAARDEKGQDRGGRGSACAAAASVELVIMLQQRDQRASLASGGAIAYTPIGVSLVEPVAGVLPRGVATTLLTANTHRVVPWAPQPAFKTQRDVTVRISLPLATLQKEKNTTLYIVPSTFEPGTHGEFLLQIFALAPTTSSFTTRCEHSVAPVTRVPIHIAPATLCEELHGVADDPLTITIADARSGAAGSGGGVRVARIHTAGRTPLQLLVTQLGGRGSGAAGGAVRGVRQQSGRQAATPAAARAPGKAPAAGRSSGGGASLTSKGDVVASWYIGVAVIKSGAPAGERDGLAEAPLTDLVVAGSLSQASNYRELCVVTDSAGIAPGEYDIMVRLAKCEGGASAAPTPLRLSIYTNDAAHVKQVAVTSTKTNPDLESPTSTGVTAHGPQPNGGRGGKAVVSKPVPHDGKARSGNNKKGQPTVLSAAFSAGRGKKAGGGKSIANLYEGLE